MERARHHNLVDRVLDTHVRAGLGGTLALRSLAPDGEVSERTFGELTHDSARVASVLHGVGLDPGDRVMVMSGRGVSLHGSVLGILRAGMVACPVFAAFGPEPVLQRLDLGEIDAVITTVDLYRSRIQPIRDRLRQPIQVMLTDAIGGEEPPDTMSLPHLLAGADPETGAMPVNREDPAVIHFTSGTTGTPKGAVHVHGAVTAHRDSAIEVFGLAPGERYWCTADPGWVTGTSYGIIAPLAVGAVTIVDEAEFDPTRWWRILSEEHIAVWYTAPTAIRMMRRSRDVADPTLDLSALRLAASVGEPLDASSVTWGERVLGVAIRDTWWQTETGSIMIATDHATTPRPGAIGRPLRDITIAVWACDDTGVLQRTATGQPIEVDEPDMVGMLAIRSGWPSMFIDYLGAHERYEKCFESDWYVTGDLVRRDRDGFVWFVGRSDDVITSAGHLIGPFEVEAVLEAHPDVLAAGVYGVPDPDVGEVVHACVVARDPAIDPEALSVAVRAHARRHLGAAVAPRRIRVVEELPTTTSGKILRRTLRESELAASSSRTGS